MLNADFIYIDHEKALLTSILDIGWFEKSQAELRKSESDYHLLFSNAPIGITVTDIEGKLIASNRAILELLGYTEDELQDINVADFYSNTSGETSFEKDNARKRHCTGL